MERASARFGLDWGQFLVLAALRGAGRPFRMSPRELHRLLLVSPAAVTNRLYRLEAKGLIERSADPTDRRSLPVSLTAQGLSTIERAMALCVESGRELLDGVDGGDVDATQRTIRALVAAYEDYPRRRRRLELAPPLHEDDDAAFGDDGLIGFDGAAMWPDGERELERLQRKLARRADEIEQWTWPDDRPPLTGAVYVSLPTGPNGDGSRPLAWAAAVVMEGHDVVATTTATRQLGHEYHPGYLALSVGPILEDVVRALSVKPEVIVVNAGGRDHERGAGLALHLGAALDVPTVGVTDRPIVGSSTSPGPRRGDWTPVRIDQSVVGFRLRTLSRGKSVTAHAGWATSAETARHVVIHTTGRTRVPEPVQRARHLSRKLRSEYLDSTAGTGFHDGIHA
jgi:deoxyribonuclease V